MTELQFMDLDVFNENWSAIAAEVRTIAAAKGKTRKRFRFLAVYETCGGELVAEVVRTSFGHVVVYRIGAGGTATWRDSDTEPRTLIPGLRHGGGAMAFDIQPLVGNPQQPFVVTCRHPLPGTDGRPFYTFPIWASSIIARTSPSELLAFR